MKLHYKQQGIGKPILFLHGVLGSLDNFNSLANSLAKQYQTIQIDLRNHGLSPWANDMNYSLMVADIIELCDHLHLTDVIVIGHSMGGKLAMQLTQAVPDLIHHIVVLDIAPVKYENDANLAVFKTLAYCIEHKITDKNQLAKQMEDKGLPKTTIQFLLKSFKQNQWLFNFTAINAHYAKICDWETREPWLKPILFIRGGKSDYMIDAYHTETLQQFPYLQIQTIEEAGHNVHAEKPNEVLHLLHDWLVD